ncbi:uncharacterized protein L201_002373 [Kwoniella dendrophila CBS 6074]|uniref:Uncharacterized protein n=1 Tax=Kwoniella dendrophila CBS 6074 TaxID=1295534 RepID=A0AAX4JRF6_9TREE
MALPTGSGKTFIMMHIIMEHLFGASSKSPSTTDQTEKAVLGKKGKALILVHKLDLVDQTLSTARRTFGNRVTIEVEQGQRTASGQADIIIASVPTLTHPDRLAKFNPSNFGLILVDEAHHAAAASWLRVLHHFNANIDTSSDPEYTEVADLAHPHDVPIIGFTASFIRWDKRQLRKVFREVPFYVPYRDLIRDNYLVPAVGAVARASLKLSEIKETGEEGDYNIDQLSEKVNESEVIDLVVRMWREKASDRRSTLVFCVCLDHLYNLQECFIRAGIDARSITGKTPVQERRQIMSDFGNGLFPVLLNCVVLTEGTDIPQIDCVFLARPTKSPGLLQQMIGRGLRPSPTTGKKDCLVIDIVDNESEIGSLDSIPELWSEIRKDMHGPRGGRNRKSRKSNRSKLEYQNQEV